MKLVVAEYHGCQKEIHRGKDTLRVINQQVTEILLLDLDGIWIGTLRK